MRWNESASLDQFTALLPRDATILDIGCGSGEPIARYLVERSFAVEGVDASPTLVGLCPIFRRHAAPGTALIFTTGTSHGEAIGSYRGAPLYHASLTAREYQTLLESNGFRVEAHAIEDPDCGDHTVWLAQAVFA